MHSYDLLDNSYVCIEDNPGTTKIGTPRQPEKFHENEKKDKYIGSMYVGIQPWKYDCPD